MERIFREFEEGKIEKLRRRISEAAIESPLKDALESILSQVMRRRK